MTSTSTAPTAPSTRSIVCSICGFSFSKPQRRAVCQTPAACTKRASRSSVVAFSLDDLSTEVLALTADYWATEDSIRPLEGAPALRLAACRAALAKRVAEVVTA